jgi:exodeoxyribonuclease V gamma subunit
VLVVHRAERATALADALAELLADPLADPFAAEVVAVPAKGVERWLAQRLSHRLGARAVPATEATPTPGSAMATGPAPTTAADGVCANVDFPSPRAMLDSAATTAAPEAADRLAAWAPERLTWAVLAALDTSLDEDWCSVPHRHVTADGAPGGRRLSLATRVAHLFDAYARSRPRMLRRWTDGDLCLADGTPLAAHEQWQPRLWRLVLEDLGASPVDLQDAVLRAVLDRPEALAVPDRLSVFGASRLARADVSLLAAIAAHRDVHLWLHHASPALWDAVAAGPVTLRRADEATDLANPLLRSLSRDVRELQHVLRAAAPACTTRHHAPAHAPAASAPTLLQRLRADLAADRVPAPLPLDPADRSVQVHACHGRTRQVEVLRDVVVGLLADDATLEPRDVLVMCPDVEAFAPLLAATFTGASAPDDPGEGRTHPAARLRVSVADRALHQSNPLLAVLDRLLDLGAARCTAGEVLDLAEHPAVARRFGLDDDAVERVRDWVRAAGVRWGLDEPHRRQWRLERVPDGTWRLGLDRLLVGAAVEAGPTTAVGLVGGVLPLDDVDSADIDLAGRLAELLDRVATVHADLGRTHPAAAWAPLLEEATLRLAAAAPGEAWQEVQLREVLDDALADHAPEGGGARLGLAELRPVLRDALAGRPTRAGFRTGALTVCTLVPMRSVPHRVVVLLGLDDGTFPRQSVRDGDDLLTRDPWVGDRDPRSEDRQLLLDAIGAAEEHLVITCTGHDERTGAPVPPAVPLGEVLDAVDRAVAVPAPGRGRDAVTTHHPLQPFDARAFTPSALGTAGPFGFDPLAFLGAVAAQGERREPPPLLAGPLPPLPAGDVALDDVVALLVHPARAFLRQRLQLSLTERDEDPEDALPLELDPLGAWQVGDRLLRDRLAGLDGPAARALERARGALPPGPLGDRVLGVVAGRVDALAAAAAPLLGAEPDAWDVDVDLGDGTRLTGTVGGVRGGCLVGIGYSTLGPKHRLAAWVRLLALTASHPDTPWRAATLGRGGGTNGSPCARSTLGPVPPATALAVLRQYVTLHRDGLRAPLPAPCKTAEAYVALRWSGTRHVSARRAAERAWVDGNQVPGEQSDAAHVLLAGGVVPFATLLEARAAPTDYHNGWPADEEGDRFGVLAHRFWDPLLRHETRDAP